MNFIVTISTVFLFTAVTASTLEAPVTIPIVVQGKEFTRVDIPSVKSNGEFTTASYYLSNLQMNWVSARSRCINTLGKKLVSINSRTKNDEVKSAIIAAGFHPANWFLTSAKFDSSTSRFEWDSIQEPVNYSNWGEYSATNFNYLPVIMINAIDRNWALVSSSAAWYFICE